MHANVSRLVLVLLLIGRKSGTNFLSQSCGIESAKPITFGHSNENRSISDLKSPNCTSRQFVSFLLLLSFFENLERLSQPHYIPTHEDILHVRQQTQGVQERKISVNSYNYR